MSNVIKEYECTKCGPIEIIQLHTEISKKCPTCKSPIERVLSVPLISKDGGPKTVGMLLEKNNRKAPLKREKVMGEMGVTEKKLEKEAHMRKLANASPQQVKRYVETGIL